MTNDTPDVAALLEQSRAELLQLEERINNRRNDEVQRLTLGARAELSAKLPWAVGPEEKMRDWVNDLEMLIAKEKYTTAQKEVVLRLFKAVERHRRDLLNLREGFYHLNDDYKTASVNLGDHFYGSETGTENLVLKALGNKEDEEIHAYFTDLFAEYVDQGLIPAVSVVEIRRQIHPEALRSVTLSVQVIK